MDKVINIKVGGNYISKDNKNAGVRGEANVTYLRITFDDSWNEYAKKITFWDAFGGNPVERTLTLDLCENIADNTNIYLVPIPGEPMAEAGTLTFVIDGYVEGKRQRSMSDKLEVKDAPMADNAGEPTDPTPTQAEQIQGQIVNLRSDIQQAYVARDEAEEYAQAAENAVGKTSYIGANGNWYAWDGETEEFYDTGVRAQGQKGDTGPQGEKGEPFKYTDFTSEQLEGLKGPKGDKGDKGDKGNQGAQGIQGVQGKDGYTPVKGVDYFTPADIASLGIDAKADKTDVEQLEEDVYASIDGVREDIEVARYDLEGKINLKADASYVDNKVANIKITTDDKLSATSENPVQNKVITSALNTKADSKEAFDGYIAAGYNENDGTVEEFDFDSYVSTGIYKLYEGSTSDDTPPTQYILCVDTSYDEGWTRQSLINLSTGEIKIRNFIGAEWKKISVTQTDLDNAIGDIETSLENIIQKYGLGGDGV